MRRIVLLVIVIAVVSAACSSAPSEPELVGIRASTDTAVGDARFLFAVAEIGGQRRGSPDETVTLVARSLDAPDVEIMDQAEFLWVVPDAFGLYRADLPFERPGLWEIDFEISTGEKTAPFLVDVLPEPTTVAAGDRAPIVETPTVEDTPISELTTDPDPMESLYEMSLDEALTDGRETVVIFATPAYCTSAACGPLLQQIKDATTRYPDVDFIHIEVYSGFRDEGFQPDTEHLVPAVTAFQLPSEPWVFVIDDNGVVIDRFEGVLGETELADAIDG